MGQRHVHADVIIAWANGEEVQREDADGWFTWSPSLEVTPNFHYGNWRIKPKIVKREAWINIYPSSESEYNAPYEFDGPYPYKTESIANNRASENRIACIRIEWEEEI